MTVRSCSILSKPQCVRRKVLSTIIQGSAASIFKVALASVRIALIQFTRSVASAARASKPAASSSMLAAASAVSSAAANTAAAAVPAQPPAPFSSSFEASEPARLLLPLHDELLLEVKSEHLLAVAVSASLFVLYTL